MAQIVSYAQGSVSLSGNPSSTFTNLFTNSSSYKTRVILAGLSFTADLSGANNFNYATFHKDGSTGYSAILGNVRTPTTGGAYSFCPNMDSVGVVGSTSASNPAGFGAYASSINTLLTSPNNVGSIITSNPSSITCWNPSTFYMGPSDRFDIKLYWVQGGTPVTATIYYSLILIQET